MTTLVTGGTGFVGSAIVRALLTRGDGVRVLVRPDSDRRNIAGLPVDTVEADLTDVASLARAVQGCTGLYHAAADYRLWAPHAQRLYQVNVEGTRALMLAAVQAGVRRIVYTSSVATLGVVPDGIADETTPVSLEAMVGDYKRSKYLAEQGVLDLVANRDLPAVIVNPSAPVGPRDIKPTPTGRMIRDAAEGRMPAYVDTGLNIVHVDDVASGHVLAFARGRVGERYVLGGENMTLQQILAVIARLSGRRPPRFKLPHGVVLPIAHIAEAVARLTRVDDLQLTVDGVRMARKHMFFSSAKAEAELGYRARPAEEALADAVAWFGRQSHA